MKADPEVLRGLASEIEHMLGSMRPEDIADSGCQPVMGFSGPEWQAILAALRAPQNDGAAAMREACAVECEEVSNERWGNTEKLVIKGLHDKATVESGAVGGARECAERIRALPLAQPDPSQEPGTGGER